MRSQDVASGVRTFGIEEEYLLLDAEDGMPVDLAAALIRTLPWQQERADREFFASQLETSTHVCHTAAGALSSLQSFRSEAAGAAAEHGAVVAGTALPPVGGDQVGTITPKLRYRILQAEMREAGAYHYASGMHVHVGVPSPDVGVEVLARLAPWAPVLLAMSANSPIWNGQPTGFASWRHLMGQHWPIAGYPPEFASADEYQHTIDQLVGSGVLMDKGVVTWVARLSERYPTVELRIADVQLEAEDAVAFAVFVRAIVDQCLVDVEQGVSRPNLTPGLVNGAIWIAARYGLSDQLVDPLLAERLPAFDAVARAVDYAARSLEQSGDRARVDEWIDGMRTGGTPAQRQVAKFDAGGITALLDLYRGGTQGVGDTDVEAAADHA